MDGWILISSLDPYLWVVLHVCMYEVVAVVTVSIEETMSLGQEQLKIHF